MRRVYPACLRNTCAHISSICCRRRPLRTYVGCLSPPPAARMFPRGRRRPQLPFGLLVCSLAPPRLPCSWRRLKLPAGLRPWRPWLRPSVLSPAPSSGTSRCLVEPPWHTRACQRSIVGGLVGATLGPEWLAGGSLRSEAAQRLAEQVAGEIAGLLGSHAVSYQDGGSLAKAARDDLRHHSCHQVACLLCHSGREAWAIFSSWVAAAQAVAVSALRADQQAMVGKALAGAMREAGGVASTETAGCVSRATGGARGRPAQSRHAGVLTAT